MVDGRQHQLYKRTPLNPSSMTILNAYASLTVNGLSFTTNGRSYGVDMRIAFQADWKKDDKKLGNGGGA